jgi:intracellular septation protein A
MRTLLGDLAAGLLFFAVLLATNDIYKATAAGIILGVAQAGWSWIRTRKIEPMQGLGSGLVLIMGGATILFHDPRFVMFKPTIFFAYHGLVMLKPGWMYRYLPAPNPARPRPASTVSSMRRFVAVAGVVYAVVTIGMAVLNMLFAMYASQKGWALFNAVGPAVVYSVLGTALMIGSRLILRNAGANQQLQSTTLPL